MNQNTHQNTPYEEPYTQRGFSTTLKTAMSGLEQITQTATLNVNTTPKTQVIIGITSSYLRGSLSEDLKSGVPMIPHGKKEEKAYTAMDVWEPRSFLTYRTEEHNVEIICPGLDKRYPNSGHFATPDWIGQTPIIANIFGATEKEERNVQAIKRHGEKRLIIRYSQFFGRRAYSGLLAEESGYAIDVPKDPVILIRFISDDIVLDALQKRNAARIREVITEFNKTYKTNIIATPYLDEICN